MRIFIAGPYGDHNTKETIARNVADADKVARDFMAQGHEVFCPHKMTWGWENDKRLTTRQFLALDKSFLRYWATAICRLPGKSPGADTEMEYAKLLGLVVVESPVKQLR